MLNEFMSPIADAAILGPVATTAGRMIGISVGAMANGLSRDTDLESRARRVQQMAQVGANVGAFVVPVAYVVDSAVQLVNNRPVEAASSFSAALSSTLTGLVGDKLLTTIGSLGSRSEVSE